MDWCSDGGVKEGRSRLYTSYIYTHTRSHTTCMCVLCILYGYTILHGYTLGIATSTQPSIPCSRVVNQFNLPTGAWCKLLRGSGGDNFQFSSNQTTPISVRPSSSLASSILPQTNTTLRVRALKPAARAVTAVGMMSRFFSICLCWICR